MHAKPVPMDLPEEFEIGFDSDMEPVVEILAGQGYEIRPVSEVENDAAMLFALAKSVDNHEKMIVLAQKEAKARIAAIKEQNERFLEELREKQQKCLGVARTIMDALAAKGEAPTDKKQRPYYQLPGIGRLRYRSRQKALVGIEYDGLTDKEREALQESHVEFFNETVTVKPDKKAIREALNKGGKVPGFELQEVEDVFELKGE